MLVVSSLVVGLALLGSREAFLNEWGVTKREEGLKLVVWRKNGPLTSTVSDKLP